MKKTLVIIVEIVLTADIVFSPKIKYTLQNYIIFFIELRVS